MMERLQFDSKRSTRKFLALLIELKKPMTDIGYSYFKYNIGLYKKYQKTLDT